MVCVVWLWLGDYSRQVQKFDQVIWQHVLIPPTNPTYYCIIVTMWPHVLLYSTSYLVRFLVTEMHLVHLHFDFRLFRQANIVNDTLTLVRVPCHHFWPHFLCRFRHLRLACHHELQEFRVKTCNIIHSHLTWNPFMYSEWVRKTKINPFLFPAINYAFFFF